MTTPTFKFNERQNEARHLMTGFMFFMLFGGSRSGKTFLAVYLIVVRAIKSSGSRHAIVRFTFKSVKTTIAFDTFPKVMKLCFPSVKFDLSKTDWVVRFPNGSEIWFIGLDDKERVEKILGFEFATMYFNESSQISWNSILMGITRLAQKCLQDNGKQLTLRVFFDCNPPNKNHWSYKIFEEGVMPETKEPIKNASDYGKIQMNPEHNRANLPDSYFKTLDGFPAHLRKRFRDGEYGDANPNAIFSEEAIDKWRVDNTSDLPQLVRVVVSVDPSGADDENNEGNDAIGIYVVGLGVNGIAYIIEDATIKAGPATWGMVAVSAYERHKADILVGEQNFGGAMVKFVIKAVSDKVNYRMVTASRGKQQRAEPFSPLFEDGRVRFVGRHIECEEEIGGFSQFGYTGSKSPNRADALFWALAELFPSITDTSNDEAIEEAIPIQTNW